MYLKMIYGLKRIKQLFDFIFHIHKYNFYAGPFQVHDGQIELGTTMMCKCGKEKNYRKKEYYHRKQYRRKQFYFDIETFKPYNELEKNGF